MASASPPSPARKAKHCTELVGAPPSLDELVPALSFLGEKLARVLPAYLARVTGGEPPLVRVGMPMDTTLGGIQSELETLASHALLGIGPKNRPVLATFEAAPVFRLVDRAFGGTGLVPDPLPDTFPVSAELLLARIEQAICDTLSQVFASERPHPVRFVRRDTSLRQLDPFDKRTDLLQLTLDIEDADAEPWSLALAFPQATLADVLTTRRPVAPRRAPRRKAGHEAEPFASLTLEITAVLVDMPISMRRLSALKPGDVIPVPVARAVPLMAGGHIIATGTVGELDDKVAVQIGQAF
ncbi:FliM/FliN family flagellar motor switch protein [Novosphingobium sp. 1949]|uniref:FliM/FliN family flagellar motor switch protein n=1 Tax=Novosphingobium organovorum TaxID=2930092 RepID=A0ABT0BDU7_9SPHN|nr:flagellar motor switch protein FliM [Novosphingobium organovorum]MCJ2183246.1 FliM/FliN family flagellar motor switch protein [Novosphingobium organovorum]